jgi:hypothetical protein
MSGEIPMQSNLDTLAEEIQHYLAAEHFVVFRGMSRAEDESSMIFWDSERSPEYKSFLDCALQLGVRLIHFHVREFSPQHREEALEQLESCGVERDEKRAIERRINDLAIYEGLTCAIELSFDFETRIYMFELRADWYDEWHDVLDEIEDSITGDDGEDQYGGGYYSNN